MFIRHLSFFFTEDLVFALATTYSYFVVSWTRGPWGSDRAMLPSGLCPGEKGTLQHLYKCTIWVRSGLFLIFTLFLFFLNWDADIFIIDL